MPGMPASRHRFRAWLGLAILPIVLTSGNVLAGDTRHTAQRILRQQDFEFCRASKQTVPLGDLQWCAVAEHATTCPEFKEMCARNPAALNLTPPKAGRTPGGRAGRAKRELLEGDSGGAPALRSEAPLWTQKLNHVLLGILFAVVIVLLARWLSTRRRWGPEALDPEPASEEPIAQPEAMEPLGEVARLLARARDMADRDLGHAHALLYAAALRHLELRGLLRWQKATTNREYLRMVRGKTALHPPLQDLVREVERHKFGHGQPERGAFDDLLRRIAPLLSLLLLVLVTGCSGPGDTTLSGRAGVWDMLRDQGIAVSSFSLPLNKLDEDSPPVFIDTRELRLDAKLIDALESGVTRGGRLLIAAGQEQDLGPWLPVAVTEVVGASEAMTLTASPDLVARGKLDAAHVLGWLPGTRTLTPSARVLELDDPLTYLYDAAMWLATLDPELLPDPGELLVLRAGQPFARKWSNGKGTVVVVADEQLFANGAMAIPGNVDLALAVVHAAIGKDKRLAIARVGLVEPAQSPTESMQRAGLWPLMVHALLALGLLLFSVGVPFGVLRDRDLTARRSFAEHVQALGLQLQRRHASRLSASLYAGWALDRLWHRHARRGQRRDPQILAQAVALRAQRPVAEVADCLQRAEALRTQPESADRPSEDLALIRDLGRLLADRPPPEKEVP